jgi:HlyD family secretion protein
MTRRQLLVSLIPLIIAVSLAAGGWYLFVRPIQVEALKVQRDVPVQVFGLGTVESRITSKVGFKVAGVLTDLLADQGDCVAKGAVLARLDAREQEARVSRAKANVEQAKANLDRALAAVAKAEASYANAKNINDRRQTLLRNNTVSVEAAETAKATLDIAQADLNLAQSDVEVARAAIRDAQAQEQLESVTLDLHTLTAPYQARVIVRERELGTALAAGEPVFTLVDCKAIWVLAYIDESKAGGIGVGQPAEIVLRSLPGRGFQGRIARIEIESDRVNEERRVNVIFDQVPQDYHLGEQAEVYITTTKLPHALLVPEAAIEDLKNDRGTVWTVEDGRLARREVTLGHRLLDGRIEILGGIPDGARVLARLPNGLRVGRAAVIAQESR